VLVGEKSDTLAVCCAMLVLLTGVVAAVFMTELSWALCPTGLLISHRGTNSPLEYCV
jgi:hypothetical protein